MKTTKIFSFIAALLAMLMVLSACGAASGTPSATQAASQSADTQPTAATEKAADPVTLTYCNFNSSGGNEETLAKMVEAFEASHPDIKVDVETIGYDDYFTQMQTRVAGGTAPDCYELNIENFAAYANKGLLAEISGVDVSGLNDTALNAFCVNGKQYGLPESFSNVVLIYNKDLFDAAGVEYPSNDLTMEDYDALARKMTSGSGDTKVYGCHYHTWRSAASLFSILDGKNTIIDGKYDFMKPTYDMVIAQQKDGICMDYGYLKTSSLHYSAAFENQQCAMVNMGSWFISTLEAYMKDAETKFNWGIVKYPHPAGAEAGSTLGTVTSLAINADSPKAEAAADFINWCVSEEGAQAIAKTGTFPACGSAATAEIIKSTEGFPEDSNSVDALTTSNVYLEMPYTQYASDIETILNAEHDAIMTMSETVDEGIQNMNDQVPAVLG